MKVILIDDEMLALTYLEYQLQKVPNVQIVGKYTNPLEGKEQIRKTDVDVVFLDIHLPRLNGLQLAEEILEMKPHIHIVFISAFDHYAVKAFELNALDYIMKPVESKRLLKTIQRIESQQKHSAAQSSRITEKLHIQLFRGFSLTADKQKPVLVRWRTSRALELFLYLLQHRGQFVRKSSLIDIMWPEYDLEKAYSQLYTTVYHIRKALESLRAHIRISNTLDGYLLTTEQVTVDVEEWENFIQSGLPINADTIEEYERRMALYSGDYLEEYDYWWAESERQRLLQMWTGTSFRMAEWYLNHQKRENAISMYLEICQRNPLAEEAHFALMKIYDSMQNHLSVYRQYSLLKAVLREELNERPSPYIQTWYKEWELKNKEAGVGDQH